MSIYRMFNGKHIDLSKVLSISDAAYSGNRSGSVYFSIEFQLRDAPIVYSFEAEGWHNEFDIARNKNNLPVVPLDIEFGSREYDNWREVAMVEWLQERVDVVIGEWIKYNGS